MVDNVFEEVPPRLLLDNPLKEGSSGLMNGRGLEVFIEEERAELEEETKARENESPAECNGYGNGEQTSSPEKLNGHALTDGAIFRNKPMRREGTIKKLKRRLSESFTRKTLTPSPHLEDHPQAKARPKSLSINARSNARIRNSLTTAPASATIAPSFFNSKPVTAFGSTGSIHAHSVSLPTRRYSTATTPLDASSFGRLATYKKMEALGEGSYATVYKGYSITDGYIVALKEIRLNSEEGTPFTAIREASLLKGLKHANIVMLYDIIHTTNNLTFVFEFVDTDLSRYMEKNPGPLDPYNVKLLLFQLLRGLNFCHSRKILHRDLKPQNILLNENGELKLADFGLARAKSVPTKTYSHEVVTLWYRPPDVLLGSTQYSTPLDMWGVGCIFVEMLTGRPLFPGIKGVYDQLNRIWNILGTPNEQTWPGISSYSEYRPEQYTQCQGQKLESVSALLRPCTRTGDLAAQILRLIPSERMLASDALKHEYFDTLPPSILSLPDSASIFLIPGIKFRR